MGITSFPVASITRTPSLASRFGPTALYVQNCNDEFLLLIDTYIFEFWTIQLKILLVPGRCRVPIDYTFMPHGVENLLSIQSIFIYAQDFRYIIVGDGVNCPLHGEKLIFCGPRIISKNKEKTGKKNEKRVRDYQKKFLKKINRQVILR